MKEYSFFDNQHSQYKRILVFDSHGLTKNHRNDLSFGNLHGSDFVQESIKEKKIYETRTNNFFLLPEISNGKMSKGIFVCR